MSKTCVQMKFWCIRRGSGCQHYSSRLLLHMDWQCFQYK